MHAIGHALPRYRATELQGYSERMGRMGDGSCLSVSLISFTPFGSQKPEISKTASQKENGRTSEKHHAEDRPSGVPAHVWTAEHAGQKLCGRDVESCDAQQSGSRTACPQHRIENELKEFLHLVVLPNVSLEALRKPRRLRRGFRSRLRGLVRLTVLSGF
jgi:hypothetical protein